MEACAVAVSADVALLCRAKPSPGTAGGWSGRWVHERTEGRATSDVGEKLIYGDRQHYGCRAIVPIVIIVVDVVVVVIIIDFLILVTLCLFLHCRPAAMVCPRPSLKLALSR